MIIFWIVAAAVSLCLTVFLVVILGITEYSLVPAENIWTAAMYARLFHVRKSPGLVRLHSALYLISM